GRLLGVVHDGFWNAGECRVDAPVVFDAAIEQRAHDLRLGQIADYHLDFVAGLFVPDLGPLHQSGDRVEHADVQVLAVVAAQVVVDHGDLIAAGREVHGGGPTQVAVAA